MLRKYPARIPSKRFRKYGILLQYGIQKFVNTRTQRILALLKNKYDFTQLK